MPRPIDRRDIVEPAHLRDAQGYSPQVHRYSAPPELGDVVRRFWLPVWSLPDGHESVQRVLQYPVCQVVVGDTDARLVGPNSGLGTQALSGSGWVAGAMMRPAAGVALTSMPMTELRDSECPLSAVDCLDADTLVPAVRAVMAPDPSDPDRQRQACDLLADAFIALLPVDEEGLLVNAMVEFVEHDRSVQRVGQVCEKFDLTERTLQRLAARRIGLSPKWLIQRRRLHDAAERLRSGDDVDLATVAADLGYSDQAHFTRDWHTVTGTTPRQFASQLKGSTPPR